MNSLTCKSCGHKLAPQDRVCPVCGSGDREIVVKDVGLGMETIAIREKEQGLGRFKRYRKWTEKISGKTKRPTREYLEIDREKHHKFHHVEEQNQSGRWMTEHHENEKLDQTGDEVAESRQSGDGSQRLRRKKFTILK